MGATYFLLIFFITFFSAFIITLIQYNNSFKSQRDQKLDMMRVEKTSECCVSCCKRMLFYYTLLVALTN